MTNPTGHVHSSTGADNNALDSNVLGQPNSGTQQTGNQTARAVADLFSFTEYNENQSLEMRASVSDVSRVYEDEAEHAGEEFLRQEYEDLGQFKLFSRSSWQMKDRMKLYFFREEIKNKTKKEVMQKYETDGVDLSRTELTAAADRHERMLNEWNQWQDDEDRVKILMNNIVDEDINVLCRNYLDHPTGMSDKDFEDAFRAILAKNPRVLKLVGKKLKHTASNVLLKLRVERANRNMMLGMYQSLEDYAATTDKDAAKNTYESTVKQLVTEYVTLTQKGIPQNLQVALNAPGENVEAYRKWMRHEIGMAKMQANTLKMKIDVLGGGKAAYEVNNKDKESLQRKWNPLKWKPMHALNSLGKVLDKYPKTSLALSVGGTLAIGIFNPAMAGFLAGAKGVAWIASKKTAHYTKEQKGQEKRLVRGLEQEKQKLANLKNLADNATMWQKISLGTNMYKGVRQGQLYAKTTQYEMIEDANAAVKNIQDKMIALDKDGLHDAVIDALMRLDYYALSGHNFFGQQEAKAMEHTMNSLQKLVVAGADTLGTTTAEMRDTHDYKVKADTLDDKYKDLHSAFKTQRGVLALKYGAAAAAFSAGMRWFLGSEDIHKHTWIDENNTNATNHTNTGTTHTGGITPKPLVDPASLKHLQDEALTAKIYGMKPEEILKHCSNINVADAQVSKKIFAEMVLAGQCNPGDNEAVLKVVKHLIETKNLDGIGEDMRDKVAYYLYHFAKDDQLLGQALKKTSQKVLDESLKDGDSSWLQAFAGGTETFVRFLGNLAAASSPLYANTFLENIDLDALSKRQLEKGFGGGNVGTIPSGSLNTVVDPNLPPIAGRWRDINPDEWVIKPGDTENDAPVDSTDIEPTVEGFKKGDKVIYKDEEYEIDEIQNHTLVTSKLVASLKDKNNEFLEDGGVKKYVFLDNLTTPEAREKERKEKLIKSISTLKEEEKKLDNQDKNILLSEEKLQEMIEFGKKYIKYPKESDTDFEKMVKEDTKYDILAKIESLMKLMEQEGEEKVTKAAQEMRKRYEDFLQNLYLLNNGAKGDASQYDKNGLARAYRDIAKQYYYFSHPETHANQKYRGYTIGNPITDSVKQQEIANRMSGWHIYRRYNETKQSKDDTDKIWYKNYSQVLEFHLPPTIYIQVKALLDKNPRTGREGEPKAPNELSSKDLALLGGLIHDNWVVGGHPDAIAAAASSEDNTTSVNSSDTTSAPDSAEPLSETAQGVEYLKELFQLQTTYRVKEFIKTLIDKFGDVAKDIYEPLFRGYDIGDLVVKFKNNGNSDSPMQYDRKNRMIYVQPQKLEKFLEKGYSLELLLSAFGHEIIHDIVDVNLKTQNKKKINNEATYLLRIMKNQNSSDQRVNDIKKTLEQFAQKNSYYVYEEVLAYGLTDPAMKKYFQDNAILRKQFEKILKTLEDNYKLGHLKNYYNATKNK